MNKSIVEDIICLTAFLILIVMTILSILETTRVTYEFCTGLLCALFCFIPVALRKLHLITVPLPLTLIAIIAIFFHAYGVLLMEYDNIHTWDTFTHTTSSVVVSLCVFYAILCIDKFDEQMKSTPLMMHIYIFLIVMTFSVAWEVFELIADISCNLMMQYSPWDTMRDFSCDALGTVIIIVYAHFYLKKRNADDFIQNLELHPGLVNYVSRHR